MEHGFSVYGYECTAAPMIQSFFGSNSLLPSKQLKVSSHIDQFSSDVIAIRYSHISRVMVMLLCGTALGVIVLVIEHGINHTEESFESALSIIVFKIQKSFYSLTKVVRNFIQNRTARNTKKRNSAIFLRVSTATVWKSRARRVAAAHSSPSANFHPSQPNVKLRSSQIESKTVAADMRPNAVDVEQNGVPDLSDQVTRKKTNLMRTIVKKLFRGFKRNSPIVTPSFQSSSELNKIQKTGRVQIKERPLSGVIVTSSLLHDFED